MTGGTLLVFLAGLTLLVAGAELLVRGASRLAAAAGITPLVVGSNVFNILAVLGFSAALSPAGIAVAPSALAFDIPVMIAVALACLPIFFTGHLVARWEGALFPAYYAAYTAFLVLDAVEHDHLETFSAVMAWFVLPLTVVTLAVLAARTGRRAGTR